MDTEKRNGIIIFEAGRENLYVCKIRGSDKFGSSSSKEDAYKFTAIEAADYLSSMGRDWLYDHHPRIIHIK